MKEYVDYLMRVYHYLLSHPEEFNKVMKPNPYVKKYLEAGSFSDEPIQYCQASPRTYMKAVGLMEKESK
jgi:hypothetical protein